MDSEKLKPCYLCLFLTIALGVGAGNLIADWIELQAANAALIEITNRLTGEKSRPFANSSQGAPGQITQPQRTRTDMSGYRTAKETCDFWIKTAEREPSKMNRMYRDTACSKLSKFR